MILMLQEKHGNFFFLVKHDEELFRLAHEILSERTKEGYWYYPPEDMPKPPDYTEEVIAQMPKSLQKEALAKLREYTEEKQTWSRQNEDWLELQRVIKEMDGRAAWHILRGRGGEYEQVSLERLETKYR